MSNRARYSRSQLTKSAIRSARHAAHEQFDLLWREKYMSRESAYRWLARVTGLSRDEAHFRWFDVGVCEAVEKLAREKLRAFQNKRKELRRV